MPRKPRIEYAGAVYHVMSRGQRREDIFHGDKDRNLFLETLGEACERTGWKIHAYVLMGNHYHLLLETPEANLVAGMKWLQTTYTARFNARHRLCGHLFQGRYKALVIDPEENGYFRIVSDYIHLNPARARLLDMDKPILESFVWSSYPAYTGRRKEPVWLGTERVLSAHQMNRHNYSTYMQGRVHEIFEIPNSMENEWSSIRRGWYLGSDVFRDLLLERIGKSLTGKKRESFSGEAVNEHDELAAMRLLQRGLQQLGVSLTEVKNWKTTDNRKQSLCWLVRSSTSVSSEWICAQLGMGHRSNISRAIRCISREQNAEIKQLKKIMLQCKD